jgi:DNA repair exonuclease SbcCD ATPase subunit
MKGFPRQQPFASKCDGAIICYSSALRLENDLLCDLLAFWAEATLPQNTEEPSFSPGTAMLINILSRSKLLLPELKCATSQIKPLETRSANPTLEIREAADTPRNNWRNNMRDVMMANTKMLNDSIMQKVEDICYDLEQRCGNIEGPLKVAEEERTKYYLEAEQLKEQNRRLQDQLQQATSTNAELREEMSRLAGHAGSATDRVNELSTSLAQARHELEELQRTSQDALSIQRELFKTRELDLVASLTEREERLDELQEEIKCQTVASGELRVNLAEASKVRESLIGEIAAFKAEVSSLQTKIEENKVSLTQKDERIKQLVVEKGRADELAKDLQNKVCGFPWFWVYKLKGNSYARKYPRAKALVLLSRRQLRDSSPNWRSCNGNLRHKA